MTESKNKVESPKFLIFAFDKEQIESNSNLLTEIENLVIGEKPTFFEDEDKLKDKYAYLTSQENIENKELYDYLISHRAEIYTSRIDLEEEYNEETASYETVGNIRDLKPFEPQAETIGDVIEVENSSRNFILDVLKLDLETDIFQFVKNPEENSLYIEFSKEQNLLTTYYNRLAKDILKYQATDVMALVKKVQLDIEDNILYRDLEKQEEGFELLKANFKEKENELKAEYDLKIKLLQEKLGRAIIDDDKKTEAESRELLKRTNEQKHDVIEAQKERAKEAIDGNKGQIKTTKYELEKVIIDSAKKYVDFDIEQLYFYEKRFVESRRIVTENFSIDTNKEIERIEKSVDEKEKLLEETEKNETDNIFKEITSPIDGKWNDKDLENTYGVKLEHRETEKEKSERISDSQDNNEEIIAESEVVSEEVEETPKVETKPTVKDYSKMFSIQEANEEVVATPDSPVAENLEENYIDYDAYEEEEPETVSNEPKTDETQEQFYERIKARDTVQFREDEEAQEAPEVKTIAKNDEAKKGRVTETDEAQEDTTIPQRSFLKKHQIPIIGGAIVLGTVTILTMFLLGGSPNKNTTLDSTPKSEKVSKTKTSEIEKSTDTTQKETAQSDNAENISQKEYEHNKKVLSESNIGMYLEDNGDLAGVFKVKDSKGQIILKYVKEYKKDGQLIAEDKQGKETKYPKEWVTSFVTMLEKTKETKKAGS